MKRIHNSKEVLDHWNDKKVESMQDKTLVDLEIGLIKNRLTKNSRVLDAGCGEGEGTLEYSKVPGVQIDAADYSVTRLAKAEDRLKSRRNVSLRKIDFLDTINLAGGYDFIITQRFLINLVDWRLQKKVLLAIRDLLRKGGKLLMLEGSQQGADELNSFRKLLGLEPILTPWHNLFFDDNQLIKFMEINGYKLIEQDGMGEYLLLTRVIRPYFEKVSTWDTEFNRVAGSEKVRSLLCLSTKCSRLKLWVFKKVAS